MSDLEDDFDKEEEEDVEEEEEEEEAGPEDEYYKGKEAKADKDKIKHFEEVIKLEGKKPAEWGFKAQKRLVKIYFKQNNFPKMMKHYRDLLTYVKSAVTRNVSEKVINGILDLVSTSDSMELLQDFYEATLATLRDTKNDRLWFKTQLKLANLYYARKNYPSMSKITRELQQGCLRPDGTVDPNKGSQLLEILALEIQMYTDTKNNKKLKEIYERSLGVKNALIHPRIMGTIRECGGKMHMYERDFRGAATDFFEAFRSFDEAGSPRRILSLKYLILASMMSQSDINPMTAQETRAFKDDPQIVALTDLIEAYQASNIARFEGILNDPTKKESIMGDAFIRSYIEDLLKNIRVAKLKNLLRPYTTIRIPFISEQISTPVNEVESLLVALILDNQIYGRIDQINQILILEDKNQSNRKYQAMTRWANTVLGLRSNLASKIM
eukprot:GAFH01001606.1.p2 GENE.GAFH01001606.1~~GAFH01001606.1.p2  ORF type:complete len:440 (+),score=155.94 GAFH01001606.1:26-1345(+)